MNDGATMAKRTILVLLLAALPALAHEGHGMPGESHWHATDAWGLVLVVALAAGAWWIKNRRK